MLSHIQLITCKNCTLVFHICIAWYIPCPALNVKHYSFICVHKMCFTLNAYKYNSVFVLLVHLLSVLVLTICISITFNHSINFIAWNVPKAAHRVFEALCFLHQIATTPPPGYFPSHLSPLWPSRTWSGTMKEIR